ncbi:MAG: glycosyltransferase [Prevotella sp.]|nr:glycosyltransferase [Prevotella sp.]
MKVLFVTARSDYGGGPRHLNQLVNGLPSDIEIFMAYPENGDPYAEIWKCNERISGNFFIPYRKLSVITIFRLRQFIKKNRINIIHSHGNGGGIYSRTVKWLCPDVKVIHTYHGISDYYRSRTKLLIGDVIGRFLSPFANLYICVSNGERKVAIERRFSKEHNTIVIYNGIPIPNECVARDEKSTPLRIVTLSRFDYSKNMESMYRIAKQLSNAHDVEFIWVGDGEDRPRLETAAQSENLPIKFVGFTREPMRYLLDSDLYISTSRFEGLPYALIEAASLGLPIVASNVKGNNEVVKHNFNGFLFNTEDEAVHYIQVILNDLNTYKRMSKASVSYYDQNFTEDKMISSILSIYRKLML